MSIDTTSIKYVLFQGVKQVLVKLGAKGSALFVEGEEPIKQPVISAAKVLDTTGAGDTFTAAFAVALMGCKSSIESLKFAGMHGNLFPYFIHGFIPLNLFFFSKKNLFLLNSLPLFTAAAASLCVQVKGAIPSMPDRKSVLDLLHSL